MGPRGSQLEDAFQFKTAPREAEFMEQNGGLAQKEAA